MLGEEKQEWVMKRSSILEPLTERTREEKEDASLPLREEESGANLASEGGREKAIYLFSPYLFLVWGKS